MFPPPLIATSCAVCRAGLLSLGGGVSRLIPSAVLETGAAPHPKGGNHAPIP